MFYNHGARLRFNESAHVTYTDSVFNITPGNENFACLLWCLADCFCGFALSLGFRIWFLTDNGSHSKVFRVNMANDSFKDKMYYSILDRGRNKTKHTYNVYRSLKSAKGGQDNGHIMGT